MNELIEAQNRKAQVLKALEEELNKIQDKNDREKALSEYKMLITTLSTEADRLNQVHDVSFNKMKESYERANQQYGHETMSMLMAAWGPRLRVYTLAMKDYKAYVWAELKLQYYQNLSSPGNKPRKNNLESQPTPVLPYNAAVDDKGKFTFEFCSDSFLTADFSPAINSYRTEFLGTLKTAINQGAIDGKPLRYDDSTDKIEVLEDQIYRPITKPEFENLRTGTIEPLLKAFFADIDVEHHDELANENDDDNSSAFQP